MAGFFDFFSSQPSNAQVYLDDAPEQQVSEATSELTGVARYLQAQKPAPTVTGVAKYLKSKQQNTPSGVAKYLARQTVAAKQKEQVQTVELTGVAKYLETHESKPQVKTTGVTKYLANRKVTAKSSVAKYVAKKVLAEKNAPPVIRLQTTGVTKYLENRKEVIVTGVGKYVARQALVAKQLAAEASVAVEAIAEPITGVEKYLQAKG